MPPPCPPPQLEASPLRLTARFFVTVDAMNYGYS